MSTPSKNEHDEPEGDQFNDVELDAASTSTLRVRSNDSSINSIKTSSEFIQYREENDQIQNDQAAKPTPKRVKTILPDPEESLTKQIQDPSWTGNTDHGIHDDFDFSRAKPAGTKSKASVPSFREATSWERWWLQSQLWNRGLVFLLLVFFVTIILQFCIAAYFLIDSFIHNEEDPSVCRTKQCSGRSAWLRGSMNPSVSPCDNFYEFICGNHTERDRGNLPFEWYNSYGRLEADGNSVLANLLKKSDDPLWKKTLKYYQACVDLRQRKEAGLSIWSTIFREIFNDVEALDLWDDTKEPRLEDIATRVMSFVGDYGLFALRDPVNYPKLYYAPIDEDEWIRNLSDVGQRLNFILPFIYDGLDVPRNKWHEIKRDVMHMMSTLDSLINQGKPDNCAPVDSQYKHYLDLNYPLWYIHLGNDSMEVEVIPGTQLKRWKLKKEQKFSLEIFPRDIKYKERFTNLFKCWNFLMQRISVENIRAVYATFWSIRIFTEMGDEIDSATVTEYNLLENKLISQRQKENLKRRLQSRCFDSMQHQMGHLPMFGIFKENSDFLAQMNKIINETATGLLRWYVAPEEGGLPLMSSFYRQRVESILSGRDEVSVLIPTREDDPVYHETAGSLDELEVLTTGDHLRNVITWKRYTINRKVHFWKRGTPKGKLVWYYVFYQLETVDAYETPAYAAYNILKFPLSLFLPPYLENDMMAMDFAGAYYLGVKAWLKLLYFDHRQGNIDKDIQVHLDINQTYIEGAISDGDFQKCETYILYENEGFKRETTTPHTFGFNYGFKDIDSNVDSITHAYHLALTIKTAYKLYLEEKRRLAKKPYWSLTPVERNHTRFAHLVNLERYSDKHVFFMTVGRHFCRSFADTFHYRAHVSRFLSTMMSLEEFSEAWMCPLGSVMNPPKKCLNSAGASAFE